MSISFFAQSSSSHVVMMIAYIINFGNFVFIVSCSDLRERILPRVLCLRGAVRVQCIMFTRAFDLMRIVPIIVPSPPEDENENSLAQRSLEVKRRERESARQRERERERERERKRERDRESERERENEREREDSRKHIELPAKLLDYFLWSDKSNFDQSEREREAESRRERSR